MSWEVMKPRRPSLHRSPSQWATAVGIPILMGLAWTLSDGVSQSALLRTVIYSSLVTMASVPLGTIVALAISRTNLRFRRFVTALLGLLLLMPAYLQISGWDAAMGLQGWMSQWWPSRATGLLSGWSGAILIQTLVHLPWVALLVSSSLAGLPPELEELASLGRPHRDVFRSVTLPQLVPALRAISLFIWIATSCEITVTDVFQIRTFAEEVYTGFALGQSIAEVLRRTLGGLLIHGTLALWMWPPKANARVDFPSQNQRAWRANLGTWRTAAGLVLATFFGMLLLIPLASLLYQAGLLVEMTDGRAQRAWSPIKAFRFAATSPWHYREEFAWSLLLGQLAAVTAMSVAFIIAWRARTCIGFRLAGWTIAIVAISVPGPVVALVLSDWVNQPNWDWLFYLYDRTVFVAWLSLSLRLFPYVYLLVDVRLRRLDRSLFDLSSIFAANSWKSWWHGIIMPLREFLLVLWLVTFALALGDLSATVLATPPGVTTVAIRIFNLVHYGVADQLAGLCLGTMAVFGLLAALVMSSLSSSQDGREETL